MKIYRLLFALLLTIFSTSLTFATSYTWNGITSSDWGTSTNWTPNGVPGASDNVTIVSAGNSPVYDGVAGITDFTISGGTLDLNGYTLDITGQGYFSGGTIGNGTVNAIGATNYFLGTVFNSKVTVVSAAPYLSGSTFNDSLIYEVTGNSSQNNGGNKFNGPVILTNSGNYTPYYGHLNPDTFNYNLHVYNTGNGSITLANSSDDHYFADTVFINCTSGQGIYFGNAGVEYGVASGKPIMVGEAGFSSGILKLRDFVQQGTSDFDLTLTSSASIWLENCEFGGDVTLDVPYIDFYYTTFNGKFDLSRSGTSSSSAKGGNLYNDTVTLINTGNTFTTAINYPDTFNALVTFRNEGSGGFAVGSNTPNNQFNADVKVYNLTTSSVFQFQNFGSSGSVTFDGDVYVNSKSSGGVLFGPTNTPTLTMTAGHTIAVGDTGFIAGTLQLRRFEQEGATPINLTLTATANLKVEEGEFGGDFTYDGPGFILDDAIFNGNAHFTRDTTANEQLLGSNTYYGNATFINNGSGYLMFRTSDTYHGDATFIATSTGQLRPGNYSTNTFKGNIHINDPAKVTLGLDYGGSKVVLAGDGIQTISSDSTGIIAFRDLETNKSQGYSILERSISILDSLILTDGIIQTDTFFIEIKDNAKAYGATDTSYVGGRVKKTGNEAFIFPIGNNGNYQPLSISAPASTGDEFIAQYYKQSPDSLYNICDKDTALDYISTCDYWSFEKGGSNNVEVTLSWDENSCVIENPSQSKIAYWDGSEWVDIDISGTTGDQYSGTVTSNGAISSYGIFTIASTTSPINWEFNDSIVSVSIDIIDVSEDSMGSLTVTIEGGKQPYAVRSGNDSYYLEAAIDTIFQNAFELDSLGYEAADLCEFNKLSTQIFLDSLIAQDLPLIIKDAKGDSVEVVAKIGHELQWYDVSGLEFVNDTIRKTGSAGWGDGYASGYNYLDSLEDGYIEFRVGDLSSTLEVGFKIANQSDMEYAMRIESTSIKAFHYDTLTSFNIGTLAENDLLKIGRSGDSIKYWQNDVLIHKVYAPSSKVLKIGVAFNTVTSIIFNMFTNFSSKFNAVLTHTSCGSPNNGKIRFYKANADVWDYDLFYNGTPIEYTSEFSPPNSDGVITWVEFSNLQPGSYNIIYRYGMLAYASINLDIEIEAEWAEMAKVTSGSNTLTKTGSVQSWGAGAATMNTLYSGEDGWITFRVDEIDPHYIMAVGFDGENENNQPTSIDYGMIIYKPELQNGTYYGNIIMILENGTVPSFSLLHHANPKSIFKIKKVGNSVKYYVNSTLIHTTTVSGVIPDLRGDVAIYTPGATVKDFRTSFICPYGSGYDNSCDYTNDYNSVKTISYDWDGNITGESIVYGDFLGREVQTQQKSFAHNDIIVAHTVYDAFGRKVLSTLPAPIGATSFGFKDNFITNDDAELYKYSDFDLPNENGSNGETDNPKVVKDDVSGTLGYYYSDNNSAEPYTATTSFPYSRIEYTADPLGETKRSSAPGDNFKMGSGHEARVFSMFTSSLELDSIFGVNKSHRVQKDTDPIDNNPISVTGGNTQALKTITVNADGQENITYAINGRTVATCRSGLSNSCITLATKSEMQYGGTQSVDVHIPDANKDRVHLLLPVVEVLGTPHEVDESQVVYKIMDLNTNKLLVEGTDYSINSSTRKVTFTGSYINGPYYLRFSFDYTDEGKEYAETWNLTLTSTFVSHELDYSEWILYFYDLAGNLRKTVSPKGFDCSQVAGGTLSMFTTYDYSSRGELITTESPDEGLVETVYDEEGKVRFKQNAEQRENDKFSYVNYDEHGRVVETGEYTTDADGIYFQNYYGDYSAPGVCSSCTSSTTIIEELDGLDDADCNDQYFTYYYELESADEIPSGYTYKSSFAQEFLLGRVSKTKNSETQTWYSYDQFGRPTFAVEELDITAQDFSATVDDRIKTVEYAYDDDTDVLLTKTFQNNVSVEKLVHTFSYDDDFRLQTVNITSSAGTQEIAAYQYYKHGPIKRIELGNDLQGLDYVYTIDGRLKALNHPKLNGTDDPGLDGETGAHSGFTPDLFGFIIDYHEGDYERSGIDIGTSSTSGTSHYNGLIDALRWKTDATGAEYIDYGGGNQTQILTSADHMAMYRYSYDNRNRLAKAQFGVYNDYTDAFTTRDDYLVHGGSGTINYDENGNIAKLIRNGYDRGSSTYNMDNLDYTYTSGTNQLASVEDNYTTAYYNDYLAAGQTIVYNSIGQMTENPDEDIDEVEYYPSGKVKKVTFASTDDYAEYFYNDRGIKYKTVFTDYSSGNKLTTWYSTVSGMVDAIYDEDEAEMSPSVDLIQRPVYGLGRVGILADDVVHYEITDHLGNVRVSFKDNSGAAELESWADYYPFGSLLPGRNSNPTTYRYSYQGQEDALNSQWKNFDLRMFNTDLGRWMAPDPYGQFHSPYLAMANNPISAIDPDGGFSQIWNESYRQKIYNTRMKYWEEITNNGYKYRYDEYYRKLQEIRGASPASHLSQEQLLALKELALQYPDIAFPTSPSLTSEMDIINSMNGYDRQMLYDNLEGNEHEMSLGFTFTDRHGNTITVDMDHFVEFGYWSDEETKQNVDAYYLSYINECGEEEMITSRRFERDEGTYYDGFSSFELKDITLDNIQTAIDVAGIADPTGAADAINGLIYAARGMPGDALISFAGVLPIGGDIAKGSRLAKKIRKAQDLYPKKAGKIEYHHINPKYLGGAANGAMVPLDAAYHQLITNEFRRLHSYGKGPVSPEEAIKIMEEVYSKYPLPAGFGFK